MNITLDAETRKGKIQDIFGYHCTPETSLEIANDITRASRLPTAYRPKDLGHFDDWQDQLELMLIDIDSMYYAYSEREFEAAIELMKSHWNLLRAAEAGRKIRDIDGFAIELIGLSQEDLKSAAETRADASGDMRHLIISAGIEPKDPIMSKKLACPKFRTRQLKKLKVETEAHLGWLFGKTGDGKNQRKWCSYSALDDKRIEAQWQKEWLAKRYMQRDEDGKIVPMSTLHEMTLEAKRSEDYAIALGLQGLAERRGLKFVMATYTLEGEWSPKRGKRASKYNGKSPKEANTELKLRLQRIRKALEYGLDTWIGFCVTEPQETGAPHLHILALVSDSAKAEEIILKYKTSETHQVDVRTWDDHTQSEAAAAIASYMTKYLKKNDDLDPNDEDALALAAWRRGAACRTTSFFGLGKGFKARWRAVYRSDITAGFVLEDDGFLAVKSAMHRRDWSTALEITGGIHPTIKLDWSDIKIEKETAYGEKRNERTDYVMNSTGEILPLKTGTWTMKEIASTVEKTENPDVSGEISPVIVSCSREPAPRAEEAPSVPSRRGEPAPAGASSRPGKVTFDDWNDWFLDPSVEFKLKEREKT